ncbi:MAG: TIGR01212 family radical SAM protein, partial [Erysipelotrichaceae bacterium]|nr:TIGR01212 family radical SAM protein [Erysipelotrichaceae bacterium]
MENPFVYSFNEKRYHTFNYYLKTTYGCKVAKVILDGGFTCPNRDGNKGVGGCIFCSAAGSGDSNLVSKESILQQYEENKKVMDRKWPNLLYIPYFQSYSN